MKKRISVFLALLASLVLLAVLPQTALADNDPETPPVTTTDPQPSEKVEVENPFSLGVSKPQGGNIPDNPTDGT